MLESLGIVLKSETANVLRNEIYNKLEELANKYKQYKTGELFPNSLTDKEKAIFNVFKSFEEYYMYSGKPEDIEKFLTPTFLLQEKAPQKINDKFYEELLYILGLEEKNEKDTLKIKPNNVPGTLYSKIIEKLKKFQNVENEINTLDKLDKFFKELEEILKNENLKEVGNNNRKTDNEKLREELKRCLNLRNYNYFPLYVGSTND
ncbi:MAG: hypothetical protein ACP5IV_08090, partial [Caldisericia bacterium]